MKILFLTLSRMKDVSSRGIYQDLMRYLRDNGHDVYIVSPIERKYGEKSHVIDKDGVKILRVRTLNIFKTNVIEKGLATVLLERQYKNAIKKYFNNVDFDIVLYSTPPITFTNVVKFVKSTNNGCRSYLLLKDIFPQNAVDLGMFSSSSPIYWYFRYKEKQLYMASDKIGCMSPANVKFVLEHNDYVNPDKVEVAPNSVELSERRIVDRTAMRRKYGLPEDKPVFIYGGNLGKPQGIGYLRECLEKLSGREDCYFLVVGDGTEFPALKEWYDKTKPVNVQVHSRLPKEDYDALVQSCDVGLIFLDNRFTIPNYPSRLLSYLEYKMPIIAATDVNTDIGTLAEENGYGLWCESKNPDEFVSCVDRILENPARISEMGERGYQFLKDNYLVEHTAKRILEG